METPSAVYDSASVARYVYLVFEHMKQDLEGTIAKIAKFAGIELDDELPAIVTEHASLPFMQNHKIASTMP